MSTIKIDNIDFSKSCEFKYRLKYDSTTDGVDTVKYVDKVRATGDCYDYLYSIYFENKSLDKVLPVKMTSSCCDFKHELKLDYRGVTLGNCYIDFTPISKVSSKYDELKKTIWYQNGFKDENQNYNVPYCSGFGFMNVVLMLLYWIALRPIVFLIKALPDWLLDSDDLGLDELEKKIHGCGYFHVAYSPREVFEFHCNKLGLTFSSSILQTSKYKDILFVPCDSGKGFAKSDGFVNFDPDNAPSYTLLQLLEVFKPVFNAKYWIEDNVLYFERKDAFEKVQDVILDLDTQPVKGDITYEYSKDSGYAYGRFAYNVDSLDQEGGDLSNLYNDIVEWNSPPSEWQKGSLDIQLRDFSPATYMRALGSSDFVDGLRYELTGLAGGSTRDMVLSNGLSSSMKLIMGDIDGSFEGKIRMASKRKQIPGTKKYLYDYDLYFNEKNVDELYNNFYAIEDPRTYIYLDSSGFEFIPENFCIFVEMLDKKGLRLGVKSSMGVGVPDGIEVDFENGIVKVNSVRWRCPLVL